MYVCQGGHKCDKYRPSRHRRWPIHTRQVLFLGEAVLCLLAGKVSWPTYFRQTANHHFTLLRPQSGRNTPRPASVLPIATVQCRGGGS